MSYAPVGQFRNSDRFPEVLGISASMLLHSPCSTQRHPGYDRVACQALMGVIVCANQIAGPVKAGEKLRVLCDEFIQLTGGT